MFFTWLIIILLGAFAVFAFVPRNFPKHSPRHTRTRNVETGKMEITEKAVYTTPSLGLLAAAAMIIMVFSLAGHFNGFVWWLFPICLLAALVVGFKTNLKTGFRAAMGVFLLVPVLIFLPSFSFGNTNQQVAKVNFVLPSGVSKSLPVSSTSPPASSPKAGCATPVYYAYKADAGTHAFGSAITVDTASAGASHFAEKMCDPLWLATTKHYIMYGENFDSAAAEVEAKTYVADHTKWIAAMQFVNSQIDKFELVETGDNVKYESLGMVTGASQDIMPTLTKFSQQPSLGQALVATTKDGKQRYFRIACDLQPAERQFPKVSPPVKPEVPPTTPPTTITPPPTTPTVPTTPSTPVTTTVPSTPTVPTTPTTPTTPVTSTTPSTPTTSTTPTTPTTSTTPTTPTTPTCPPGQGTPPDCLTPKDPSVGVPPPPGHTSAPAPTGSVEVTVPPETHTAVPTVSGASHEPSQPTPSVQPTVAPSSSAPGGNIPTPSNSPLMGLAALLFVGAGSLIQRGRNK